MTFGEKLKQLRGGKTQADFAALIGEDRTNLNRYESNKQTPGIKFFEKLQRNLGININWFFDDTAELYETETPGEIIEKYGNEIQRLPVLGYADCGLPTSQWPELETDFIIVDNIRRGYREVFALKAEGDSMTPYINAGDHLICAAASLKNIKDYHAVIILYKSSPGTAESNAKLFYRDPEDNGAIIIYSINTKYPPKKVYLNDIEKMFKLIKIIREVK
jgi:transcriptional regulator with XRE-family HTH domain